MRRLIPVCLYEGNCRFKAQDKKTKLPLCKNYDRRKGAYSQCNQQLFLTTYRLENAGSLEELRKLRFDKLRF